MSAMASQITVTQLFVQQFFSVLHQNYHQNSALLVISEGNPPLSGVCCSQRGINAENVGMSCCNHTGPKRSIPFGMFNSGMNPYTTRLMVPLRHCFCQVITGFGDVDP